jgi:diguanylate cyclase (GGDEF)-like protein
MAFEALLVSALFLGLARLRPKLGLAPLYLAVGSLQFLQVVLASSVYIEVLPGILVSPGSAVLFTGTIFSVLVLYVLEGVLGARRIIYSVVIANVVLGVLGWLMGFHTTGPGVHNFLELPRELFDQGLRVMVVGTIALYVDVVLLVVLYEKSRRWLGKLPFVHALIVLWTVLAADGLMFVGGVFTGEAELTQVLLSNVLGKWAGALIFALVFAAWLRTVASSEDPDHKGVFGVLLWQRRFQELQVRSLTDPLTSLHNRAWYEHHADEVVPADPKRPCALLLIDLDHFKQINDQLGHAAGDEVLRRIGPAIRSAIRDGDRAARIGGEEFVVLLPGASPAAAQRGADRILQAFRDAFEDSELDLEGLNVTATIGVACQPEDGVGRVTLFARADRRLYAGKAAGRNRVVCKD